MKSLLWLMVLYRPLLVVADITGFFKALSADITGFALAASVFFFAWAAIMYMTAGHNDRRMEYARMSLYSALTGLALALLSNAIATLVYDAANTNK